MNIKRILALLLTLAMLLCTGSMAEASAAEITITDMIGREVTVTPGSYQRVVCIGARCTENVQLHWRRCSAVRR